MNDKAEDLRSSLQQQIVQLIQAKVASGEMTVERSKELAQFVLQMLPQGITYTELIKIIPKLDDHFVELAAIVVPIMSDYEKKMKAAVDQKLKQLISAGHFDAAMEVTKKAIEFEKELS